MVDGLFHFLVYVFNRLKKVKKTRKKVGFMI